MGKELWDKDRVGELLRTVAPRSGEFAEVYLEKTNSTFITLRNNGIEKIESDYDQGINIRVGELNVSFCLSSLIFDKVFKKARAWAKDRGFGSGKTASFTERDLPSYSLIRISPQDIPLAKKVELLQRSNEAARACDKRITQVDATFIEQIKQVLVANSEGIFETDERIYLTLRVQTIAKKNGLIQTGYFSAGRTQGFELFDEETPEKIAQESARLAISQLEARPAPAGVFTVILHSDAGGTMIHEAVGHGLEADHCATNFSVYAGKLGQRVASELITVVDDRTMPGRRGTAKIDDEGWPAQRTVLIEKGVLVNLLCDRKYAKELGFSQNGHGRRQSYRFLPIPRMGNTFIAAGKDDSQEIIESVNKGILVKKMGGGLVKPVTGEFIFEITEAYLIEKGKIKEPIRGATLIGNCLEVMKGIDMVGNDLKLDDGGCGKDNQVVPVGDGLPTIRISKITVGGLIE